MEFKTLEILTARGLGPLECEVTLSSEAVDREGDVVSASGWNIDAYRKNPIVLLHHDYKSLPVAKMEQLTVAGGKLVGRLVFPPPGVSARADEARALLKEGFLSGVSVGFKPIRSEPNRKSGGTTFLEQELLELSLVSIPANEDAVVTAKGVGRVPECPRGRQCQYSVKDGRCQASNDGCPLVAGLPSKSLRDALADVAPEIRREAAERVRAALAAKIAPLPVDRGENLFERLDLVQTPQARALRTLANAAGLNDREVADAVVDGLHELRRSGELQIVIDREVRAALRALSGRLA